MSTHRGNRTPCFLTFLIITLIADISAGQTIKIRSREAYRKLAFAGKQESIELLNELTTYRMLDSLDRAGELAARAVAISEGGESLAKSLVLQAMVLTAMQMPDSALAVLHQANKIYRQINLPKGLGRYYLCMGKIMALKKMPEKAVMYFTKATESGRKEADYFITGSAFLRMAEYARQEGKRMEYVNLLAKAETFLHMSTDSVFTGNALMGLGISYLDLGMHEKANRQIFVALRILEKSADSLFLGYALVNIASLYAIPSEDKPGLYYRKALAIFRALKNDKAVAYALNQRGIWYLSNNDYYKALPEFLESAKLKRRTSDWQGACFAYGNLVDIYTKINRTGNAANALKCCEQMASKAGDQLSLAVYKQSDGMWHYAIRNFDYAIKCYESSLEIARKIPVESIVIENLKAISEAYQANGDPATALKYYKYYTTARDSIDKSSDIAAIANIQLQYEAEHKDKLITELKDSVENREKSRQYLQANIIALVLAFFISIIFWIRYRQKRYYNPKNPTAPDKASKVILTEEKQEALWEQLNSLLQKEKLYLRNDLSLAELSRKLNTNTTYLSKVINETNGENFSQLLNHYRIDEACMLLSGQQAINMTIEGIARMAGFNSKSAFNAAFKKNLNITPSEYIALQTKEREQMLKSASCSDL